MRKFNKQLNQDITELKTLHMKKDKTDFRKRKAEIMAKHNISKATVYREMNKDMPGSYQQPKYSNKAREVTEKEKEMVRNLLFKKTPHEQICNEMMKLTKESYSWDRFDQVRKEIEEDDRLAKEKRRSLYEPIVIGEITGEVVPLKKESAWGGDIKSLLEKLLNLDKIDKDSYVPIIVKGKELKATEETRRDIMTKLANTADADGIPVMASIDADHKHLLKELLRNMKSGMKYSVRDLYEIRKMYKEMSGGNILHPVDFEFVCAVVLVFDPDATIDQIENVVYNKYENYPGRSKELMPDMDKMNEKLLEEMNKRG